MEFISGKNLAEMLLERKNVPFSPKEYCPGLIHCSMSWPFCIVAISRSFMVILSRKLEIDWGGQLVLLDFGLAKGRLA